MNNDVGLFSGKEIMKKALCVRISEHVINKMRDVVYWTPGMTMSDFVEESVQSQVGQYERERGSAFPDRRSHKANKGK